jgi:hypothetical protein
LKKNRFGERGLKMSQIDNINDIIKFRCVQEGRRLRVKIITQGYNHEANCQFPRAIRKDGGVYEAPCSAVKFAKGPRGKFFYRVNANSVKVIEESQNVTVGKIYEDEENTDCVICFVNPHELVYVPCGHFCTCNSCHSKMCSMNKRRCPMCRAEITNAVNRDQIQT